MWQSDAFSKLRLWEKVTSSISKLHLCSFNRCLMDVLLISIKDINRLISKSMSNIYLNFPIEKNWHYQKLSFSKFRRFVFGKPQLTQISLNFKASCCNSNVRDLQAKGVWVFCYFNFEKNYDIFKSKDPWFLLNKKLNFNKNEMESKIEDTTHGFREGFSSCKNYELKVKLWRVGARKKIVHFFNVCFVRKKVF